MGHIADVAESEVVLISYAPQERHVDLNPMLLDNRRQNIKGCESDPENGTCGDLRSFLKACHRASDGTINADDTNHAQQRKAVAANDGCRIIRKPKQTDRNRKSSDGEAGAQDTEQKQREPGSGEQFGISCAFVNMEKQVGGTN